MADLTVEKMWVVGANGHHWIPKQKEVNGRMFLALHKWDRGGVRVLSGHALDLRQNKASGGSLHSTAWEELVKLRQEKADELLEAALKCENEEDQQIRAGKKRKAPARAVSKHDVLVPNMFSIVCRGHELMVLFEGISTQTLWMELTEDNLTWFRGNLRAADRKPKQNRASRGQSKTVQAKAPERPKDELEADPEDDDECIDSVAGRV